MPFSDEDADEGIEERSNKNLMTHYFYNHTLNEKMQISKTNFHQYNNDSSKRFETEA